MAIPGLKRVGREGYHPNSGLLIGALGKGRGSPWEVPAWQPNCCFLDGHVRERPRLCTCGPRRLSLIAEPSLPVPGGGVEGRTAGSGNVESAVPWRPGGNFLGPGALCP